MRTSGCKKRSSCSPDFWLGVLGAFEKSRKKLFTTLLQ
jgi:hypothetical protein